MSIFNLLSQRLHYYFDNIFSEKVNVKIERFEFLANTNDIVVRYRLGRQKLSHTKEINKFENDFYEKLSTYDQHRLTKFSTLQSVLLLILDDNTLFIDKNKFITYILNEAKHEQLF